MARQNILRNIRRDPKTFIGNVGQGFQNERARPLTPDFASFPDRESHGRAISSYAPSGPEVAQERASKRQADFLQFAVPYDGTPFLYLPAGPRIYFFLQNLDLALNMWLGVGVQPNPVSSLGIKIGPGQAYEPWMIPQNDIWIAGDGVGEGTLVYAVS